MPHVSGSVMGGGKWPESHVRSFNLMSYAAGDTYCKSRCRETAHSDVCLRSSWHQWREWSRMAKTRGKGNLLQRLKTQASVKMRQEEKGSAWVLSSGMNGVRRLGICCCLGRVPTIPQPWEAGPHWLSPNRIQPSEAKIEMTIAAQLAESVYRGIQVVLPDTWTVLQTVICPVPFFLSLSVSPPLDCDLQGQGPSPGLGLFVYFSFFRPHAQTSSLLSPSPMFGSSKKYRSNQNVRIGSGLTVTDRPITMVRGDGLFNMQAGWDVEAASRDSHCLRLIPQQKARRKSRIIDFGWWQKHTQCLHKCPITFVSQS